MGHELSILKRLRGHPAIEERRGWQTLSEQNNYKTSQNCPKNNISRLQKLVKGKQQIEHCLFVRNFGTSSKKQLESRVFLQASEMSSATARGRRLGWEWRVKPVPAMNGEPAALLASGEVLGEVSHRPED